MSVRGAPAGRGRSTDVRRTMGAAEWSLLVAMSGLAGGSFFFYRVLTEARIPTLTIVAARVGIGAVALLAVVWGSGLRLPPGRAWAPYIAMGVLNNVIPFTLIVFGETQIGSGLASILNATTPAFTVVAAHYLTRDEPLTANRLGGILLGLAGVVVMIGPEALGGIGRHVLAQVSVLGAAVSYAFAGIYGRRFRGTPPLITAAGQVTGAALVLLPVACLVDRPWAHPAPAGAAAAALLGLGLLSTALLYVLYFSLLARAGATNLLLFTILVPVSALALGVLGLGEHPGAADLTGLVLIAAGLVAIDGRVLGLLRRTRESTGAAS